MVELGRAERAWQESEFLTPGYAMNGFIAAFAIARARGDAVAAAHIRELIDRLNAHTDPGVRTRRMAAFIDDDFEGLASIIADYLGFSPRLDYIYQAASYLADRRQPAPGEALDRLIAYTTERELRLVSSVAYRLRGVLTSSRDDLEAALAAFEAMGARPESARVRTELGLLTGDGDLVERGISELEAIGDIAQAARVAAERKAGVLAAG
jgi:hypothetical protein